MQVHTLPGLIPTLSMAFFGFAGMIEQGAAQIVAEERGGAMLHQIFREPVDLEPVFKDAFPDRWVVQESGNEGKDQIPVEVGRFGVSVTRADRFHGLEPFPVQCAHRFFHHLVHALGG